MELFAGPCRAVALRRGAGGNVREAEEMQAPEVSDELKAEIAEFRKASVTCRNPCCLNPNEQVEPLSWSQYVRALCGSAKHG